MGLTKKRLFLAGIIVPKSAMMLKYMDSFSCRRLGAEGNDHPDEPKPRRRPVRTRRRSRVARAGSIKITIELIHQALENAGRQGVHIPGHRVGSAIEGIVKAAGCIRGRGVAMRTAECGMRNNINVIAARSLLCFAVFAPLPVARR